MDEFHARDLLGAFGFCFVLCTKVAINQQDVAERHAWCGGGGGVIGRIHQIIELEDAGAGHGHQGNGDLAVTHGGRGQHASDRNLAAGDIDMQLIADPCLLIALAVLLGADIARGGEIGE